MTPRKIRIGFWIIAFSAVWNLSAVEIVAHRGASFDAPENTLAAFHIAWEQDADAIEGDFYLTKDGQIVCIHDKSTKRTTGNQSNLKISESRFKQLSQWDVGSWKNPRWHQQRIPTLSEVLATVPPGKKILIEIKCGPEIVPALKETLARASLNPEQMIVISFNDAVVTEVKREIPRIKAYWLTGFKENKLTRKWHPSAKEILHTLKKTGADGLDANGHAALTSDVIRQVKEAGYEVHVWTIDEPESARHWHKLGVDSITTNRPRLIRESLAKP